MSDYNLAVSKLFPGEEVDYNPKCFDFTEAEARAKKLWRDSRPMPTMGEINAALLDLTKNDQIEEAYDQMVKDVYDQMEATFSTRNDVSAAAFASTYEAMVNRPANYVDAELGLADEAAVTAFAQAKIAAADAYGVFRMKRIAQYQALKESILNG